MDAHVTEGADTTPVQRALAAIRSLRGQLRELESLRGEPIAVVGIGCRFPGDGEGPDAFWRLLESGGNAISEIPRDRWDVDRFYDPRPGTPNRMYTRHGAFLDQVDGFDAKFFNISPREAERMDPQQRMLLETTWHALEHAGINPLSLRDSATGVFVGLTLDDYGDLMSASGIAPDAHTITGTAHNVAAGRISYTLGLRGPSLAIDTACSSSLVAVHLACRSLRLRECDLALAGGVNLMLSPQGTILACQTHMLAADGQCKVFDAAADGYVRGEGCGVIALKRLSDALQDASHILAVIRGSFVNHDGASSGLTVPNIKAQQDVIRGALADAGVTPDLVGYVEAHGTGTSLGDPIEFRALADVFGGGRPADRPLRLGAVKTNIGHTEAAAGIASVIKVILAQQHRTIPPHRNLAKLNPEIKLERIPAQIPTQLEPWSPIDDRYLAGVSSFGFSGTNAHVIVEAAPAPASAERSSECDERVLTLSAKSETALKRLAESYAVHLDQHPELEWRDICYTSNVGRAHWPHRVAVVAREAAQAIRSLRRFAQGETSDDLVQGTVDAEGGRMLQATASHAAPRALANLYVKGCDPDWVKLYGGQQVRRVVLPTYPFDRQSYWFEKRPVADGSSMPMYEVRWAPSGVSQGESAPFGTWLLVTENADDAAVLRNELERHGCTCWTIETGRRYAAGGSRFLTIDPGRTGHIDRMFDHLMEADGRLPDRVVYLHTAANGVRAPVSTAEALRASGCAPLLHVVQALLTRGGAGTIRLLVVTRGAQVVGTEDRMSDPFASAVWGMARTIATEHPTIWGGILDADRIDDSTGSAVVDCLCTMSEVQMALRNHQYHVARLEMARGSADVPPPPRGDRTYLITGGTGGLGLAVADWMVGRGARHVALVARRAPEKSSADVIVRMKSGGAEVSFIQADVAKPDDVACVLGRIRDKMPPLAGIIHTAGVIDDAPIAHQAASRFEGVFAAKVTGAWNLHVQTRDMPLDLFVLFSSTASLLGPAGQCNYAAANAFLDALAHHRRHHGLPATSVNWGPWAKTGMASRLDSTLQEQLRQRGVGMLDPAHAVNSLELAVNSGIPQLTIARVDWSRYVEADSSNSSRSFLSNLTTPRNAAGTTAKPAHSVLLERLNATSPSQHRRVLVEHVQAAVADVLRLGADMADPHTGFFDMGMDSLMGVELRNRLQQDMGDDHPLPATLVMDAPSIESLADYLLSMLTLSKPEVKVLKRRPAEHDPIAVVGMACRFPGGANDPAGFWELLREGRDTIDVVPADRWRAEELLQIAPNVQVRYGGFVDGADQFDPRFFGIAPREALVMDPQQRILLEVAWEALEDAGIAADRLRGTAAGVYIGICNNDYAERIIKLGPANVDAYFGIGSSTSSAAGRLSYLFGLQGPSFVLNTACSSSLVAVHEACQSLRSGECEIALAGGVNLIISPLGNVSLSQANMLAPDGRCKTFDDRADGYVRSDGCGILVLKPLSKARADGDRILAVIRGTAVNQDGRSSGLTVPNGPAQEAVIRAALRDAGILPDEIDYVEAHGTGTSLGDPIEIQALGAVFGESRSASSPLPVGSVKTNIGHTEAAAGVAGLIKVVLAMQHDQIPPHLHFERPNRHVDWGKLAVSVTRSARPWPRTDRPRAAGVSSFGFIGTNAHVVLTDAPKDEAPPPGIDRPLHVLPISARSDEAFDSLLALHRDRISSAKDADIAAYCHTAGVGRSHFAHRTAIIVSDRDDALNRLNNLIADETDARTHRAARKGNTQPRIAFLFTGQGSQYAGMGRQLYATQPEFRRYIDRCDEIFSAITGVSLISVVYPDGSSTSLNHTAFSQPALFAFECGWAELWRSWGVEPAAVLGHSVGQYAAACAAGVFSLEDGMRLMIERGRLMQGLPRGGAMAAVLAGHEVVSALLDGYAERVWPAAFNSPKQTVISGEREAIDEIIARCTEASVPAQRLEVSHAFHSGLLDPMLDDFEAFAGTVELASPNIDLVCNLTGSFADPAALTRADYWRRHAREPVRFESGVRTLIDAGIEIFVEIGPHPVLSRLGRDCDDRKSALWLTSIQRGRDEWPTLLNSLAKLYVGGVDIDWAGFDRDYARRRTTLPGYAFQRQRYWIEDTAPAQSDPGTGTRFPLLARRTEVAESGTVIYEARLAAHSPAFLEDHRLFGQVVVPGAVYVAMALTASSLETSSQAASVKNVTFREARVLDPGSRHQLQLSMDRSGAFSIHTRDAGEPSARWTRHAAGKFAAEAPDLRPGASVDMNELREGIHGETQADFYARVRHFGLELGPSFQVIRRIWHGRGQCLAELQAPPHLLKELADYLIHPAVLDACFQATGGVIPRDDPRASRLHIPVEIQGMYMARPAPPGFRCRARMREDAGADAPTLLVDIDLIGDSGNTFGRIEGLCLMAVSPRQLWPSEGGAAEAMCYTLEWTPSELPTPPAERDAREYLLVGDHAGLMNDVAREVRRAGARCTLVEQDSRAESLAEELSRVLTSEPKVPLSVVYLPAPGARADNHWHAGDVSSSLRQTLGGAMRLVQAIGDFGRRPCQLTIVTCGAQSIGDSSRKPEKVDPVGATLWGLCASMAVEYPELRPRAIDLDPVDLTTASRDVLAALAASDDEPRVAYRQGQRFTARLRSAPREIFSDPYRCRDDATYVITGGTGGLGRITAEWLADRGAKHLAIVARQQPDQGAYPLNAGHADRGLSVRFFQCDVADPGDVERLLQELANRMPPIRGVIHAAGALNDGLISQQNWADYEKALSGKAVGAWNLHAVTRETPLDFFVMFSSTTALLGNAGQAGYGAANAFCDALAHLRRALGLPALSINWGPWDDAGMAAGRIDDRTRKHWADSGIGFIRPAAGATFLDRLVGTDAVQVVAIDLDPEKLGSNNRTAAVTALLRNLLPDVPGQRAADVDCAILARLRDATAGDREEILARYLQEEVADVLGGGAITAPDVHVGLLQLGMDSIMALDLKSRLEASLGITMPLALIMQDTSILDLLPAVQAQISALERSSLTPAFDPAGADDLVSGEL